MKRTAPFHFGPPSAMSTMHRRHRAYAHKPKKDLTQGPVLPQLIVFCVPLMLSGMLQLLYNATDMIVLGQFASDTAVGAVGACSSLINLIVNLFIGLAVGVSVGVSQFIGAKRDKDVSEIVHTALSLSLIMGVIVGAIGFMLAEPALRLMGTLEETMAEAVPYMRAYMAGVPGVMVYNYCAAALRAKGDTVRPLIFLAISGLSNVLLNLWMVLGFGMGAVGVGIATAVSQYLAAIMIVVYMSCFLKDSCRISLRHMTIKRDKLYLMLKLGIPAGLQGVLFSFSNVLIQSSINSFGIKALVDGNAASANVEGFIYTAMNSVYQGAITFVGQHVGARRFERINRVIFSCMGLVTVIGLITGGLVILLGRPLLHFYISSPEAIWYGQRRMMIICSGYFLCGLMEVGCGVLRGMGKTFMPMIVSLAGACGLRILWILTIFRIPAFHTVPCLYISWPISWLITATVHFILAFSVKKRMQRSEQPPLTDGARV